MEYVSSRSIKFEFYSPRRCSMSKQNVYDNAAFFDNFQSSRSNTVNFNDCIETPILFGMLPDLHGKKVLDIGCGMGQHAKQYADMGAASVLGIDLSEKMLVTPATGVPSRITIAI